MRGKVPQACRAVPARVKTPYLGSISDKCLLTDINAPSQPRAAAKPSTGEQIAARREPQSEVRSVKRASPQNVAVQEQRQLDDDECQRGQAARPPAARPGRRKGGG